MIENSVEVLLVEDNPNDVELTLLAFKEARFANRIKVARDGEEALHYIFGVPAARQTHGDHPVVPQLDQLVNRPRMILLDLKLPKVDGLEVLEKLKTDPLTRSIPIVVLTSSREDPDINRCYQLGVNSYIVKPVNFVQFLEAVRELGFYWLLLNQPAQV